MMTKFSAEQFIWQGFWFCAVVVVIAFILPLVVPVSGPGPDRAAVSAMLFFLPLVGALAVGLVMAGVTAFKFRALSRRHRWMGFAPFCLVALGFVVLELLPAFF
jgi:hypothetical protein